MEPNEIQLDEIEAKIDYMLNRKQQVLDKWGETTPDTDYRSMSNLELDDRMESGELQTNPALLEELNRRMKEHGTSYQNTPKDWERCRKDTEAFTRKIMRIELEKERDNLS